MKNNLPRKKLVKITDEKLSTGMRKDLNVEFINSTQSNYYDGSRKTIVLDEKLEQYPELQERVLGHELEHYRNDFLSDSFWGVVLRDLKHDLVSDFFRYSSTEKWAEQSSEYKSVKQDSETVMQNVLGNLLRTYALIIVAPAGFFVKTVELLYFKCVSKWLKRKG